MKKLLLILLILPLFGSVCSAEGIEEETARAANIEQVEEGLEQSEREISGELLLDGSYDARGALGRLWDRLVLNVQAQFKQELRSFSALVVIALLCGLASTLCPGKKIPEYLELAACSTAVLLLAGSVEGVILQATNALQRLSEYSKISLPAFFTAVAACGAAVSASVKFAAACFSMDVFMTISQRLVLPLIYAFLAVSICGSLFENPILSTVSRVLKWCAITSMTAVTTAFCIFISLSGLIAGSTDAAAIKTTKTVIAAALPVVGGILSDSASAVLGAAAVIKNSAGVFGLIAVCSICAGPFAVLSVKMLLYKACSALSELSCGGRYAKLLGNIGTVFSMLLGLVGSCGIMLFLSFMSGIRMVTA